MSFNNLFTTSVCVFIGTFIANKIINTVITDKITSLSNRRFEEGYIKGYNNGSRKVISDLACYNLEALNYVKNDNNKEVIKVAQNGHHEDVLYYPENYVIEDPNILSIIHKNCC